MAPPTTPTIIPTRGDFFKFELDELELLDDGTLEDEVEGDVAF